MNKSFATRYDPTEHMAATLSGGAVLAAYTGRVFDSDFGVTMRVFTDVTNAVSFSYSRENDALEADWGFYESTRALIANCFETQTGQKTTSNDVVMLHIAVCDSKMYCYRGHIKQGKDLIEMTVFIKTPNIDIAKYIDFDEGQLLAGAPPKQRKHHASEFFGKFFELFSTTPVVFSD